ncbi:MAG: acyl carrier protein [Verrucomicrobia bacterium]|nr:acyl carrier protein [Verrucomicrobiota bacterium]
MAIEINEQIRQYVSRNLLFSENGYPYEDGASFLEKGVIDSLGVMDLVDFVSKRFAVTVDPRDVVPENFDSVSRLADYVRRKTESPQPASAN